MKKVQPALSVEGILSKPENVSFRRSNEAGGGRESPPTHSITNEDGVSAEEVHPFSGNP
jgi:hypothetical protein